MVKVAPMKSNTVTCNAFSSSQYLDTLKRSPIAATPRRRRAAATVITAASR
jgi:hypothetical protein